jgi:hypothetical protein
LGEMCASRRVQISRSPCSCGCHSAGAAIDGHDEGWGGVGWGGVRRAGGGGGWGGGETARQERERRRRGGREAEGIGGGGAQKVRIQN